MELLRADPVTLDDFAVQRKLVFQHSAVVEDGFRGGNIRFVTGDQGSCDPQLFCNRQRQRKHPDRIPFSALEWADSVSDMTAGLQQFAVQLVTDVDRSQNLTGFIRQEENVCAQTKCSGASRSIWQVQESHSS